MESFIVGTMIKSTSNVEPRKHGKNSRVKCHNAELITEDHFLDAAAKNTKEKESSVVLTKPSCSKRTNELDVVDDTSSNSETEIMYYDSEIFDEPSDYTNTVNVNFVRRNAPNIAKKLQIEKIYVITYKTKLYIGKIKSIEQDKPLVTAEFMEQQPNNRFVWKGNPK